MPCILGIDTSNYTTSLAVVDVATGELLAEHRMLLPVQTGERGLRQSDALFFHVQQLPTVMMHIRAKLQHKLDVPIIWRGVGVSVRPRPLGQSYMPVFSSGESLAYSFAQANLLPVVRTSHQEGHLAAAEHFLPYFNSNEPFLAVHLSGGTSDVMWAQRTRFGYRIDLFGEGSDLHAGQFVDRVGVALGLPFPAGPHLEALAKSVADGPYRLPSQVSGARMSFSGPCSAALRAIGQGVSAASIARAVEAVIANSVVKALLHGHGRHPVTQCVIAGGVASNAWIRERILHRMNILTPNLCIHFAPIEFSADNALGVAKIARDFWHNLEMFW